MLDDKSTMNLILTRFALILLILATTACGTSKDFVWGEDYNFYDGYATIEDFVVGSDYEIISVDGAPPERQEHGRFITVVPLVKVKEGIHVLTIRPYEFEFGKTSSSSEILEMTVLLEKNGRYRLMKKNGIPTLIKLSNEPSKQQYS